MYFSYCTSSWRRPKLYPTNNSTREQAWWAVWFLKKFGQNMNQLRHHTRTTGRSPTFLARPDMRPDPGAPLAAPRLEHDLAHGKCTFLTKNPVIFLQHVQDRVLTMVRHMVLAQKSRSGPDREHVTCDAVCDIGRVIQSYSTMYFLSAASPSHGACRKNLAHVSKSTETSSNNYSRIVQ